MLNGHLLVFPEIAGPIHKTDNAREPVLAFLNRGFGGNSKIGKNQRVFSPNLFKLHRNPVPESFSGFIEADRKIKVIEGVISFLLPFGDRFPINLLSETGRRHGQGSGTLRRIRAGPRSGR